MKFFVILCEVFVLGIAHLADAQLSDKFYIRHLAPPEGPGYDLFYYDGVSLRDEKWRFDHANQDTAVHRRFGLKDEKTSQFHVVDTLSDANGFRQKTRILNDLAGVEGLLAMGIEPPTTKHAGQKSEIRPRIKLRDNSEYEGQPRDSSFGFLNGVSLGITLNQPTTPGGSYVQGFVQTGLGAQNNQPALQFDVPFLSGGQQSNSPPASNRPAFSFPFFGNNGATQSPPPPPPQPSPGIFGFPFGNRETPPPPTAPPQQQNFLAGLQNLNIPFIGQNKPITTTTTTPAPHSIFGFNLPSITGIFNNNKGGNKKIDNRFGPPGHAHGHRHPPKHPNRPPPSSQASPFHNVGGETTLTSRVDATTEHLAPTILEVTTPSTTTTTATITTEKLVSGVPIETGLLQSNAVELSTDPDIPSPIEKPFVEPLVDVVEQNAYALGIQEASTISFSNVEPTISSSTPPIDSSRSDVREPTTITNIPAHPLPNVTESHNKATTMSATTETVTTNQIILDINSLSENPPFPTLPSSKAESLPSPVVPYPTLDLLPPFETEPGVLGIHEDLILSRIGSSDNETLSKPRMPGIIELITKSQQNLTNEKLIQTEALLIESKPNEIIQINNLEQQNKVNIPETEVLPPFENYIENNSTNENTVTTTQIPNIVNIVLNNVLAPEIDLLPPLKLSQISEKVLNTPVIFTTTATSISSLNDVGTESITTLAIMTTTTPSILEFVSLSNVQPEIDILPPFESSPSTGIPTTMTTPFINTTTQISTTNLSTESTTTTQKTITTSHLLPEAFDIAIPEKDLLPPLQKDPVVNETREATPTSPSILQPIELVTSIPTTSTTPFITTTTQTTITSHVNTKTTTTMPRTTIKTDAIDVAIPKTDLLPPFKRDPVFVSKDTQETATATPSSLHTKLINVVQPEIEILPPFEINTISNEVQNTTTATTNIPTTTTPRVTTTIRVTTESPTTTTPKTIKTLRFLSEANDIAIPETDLLPPFVKASVPEDVVNALTTSKPTATTTTTAPKTTTISFAKSSPRLKNVNVIVPEINLLPPFEGVLVSDVFVNKVTSPITTIKPKTTTQPTTTSTTIASTPNITTTPATTTVTPLIVIRGPDFGGQISTTTPNTTRVSVMIPRIELLPPLQGSITTTFLNIQRAEVTAATVPIVTDDKVKPIYQRTTTITPVKQPAIDLLPPLQRQTTTLSTKTTQLPPTVATTVSVMPSSTTTNKGVSKFISLLNSTVTLTTPRTTTTTTKKPRVPKKPSKLFLPPFEKPAYKLDPNAPSIAKPSTKIFPPHETPIYKFEPNENPIKLTARFDNSVTARTSKILDQTTIRTETDRVVNNVRKIIEHTSQSILPTATVVTEPTTRFNRSPKTTGRPNHFHGAKRNKHKFNSYVQYPIPATELLPPPRSNPGQLDVYELDRRVSQNGQSLDELFIPNVGEMHALPTVPTQPSDSYTQTPATVIRRPVFINVEDEEDTETTTSLLDMKLGANAIKSLIG